MTTATITTTTEILKHPILEKLKFNVLPVVKEIEIDTRDAEQIEKVLAFLDSNGDTITIHDDHNSGDVTRQLQAVVILASGKICESFHKSVHCLNPLYINREEQNLHLSTWSCGGNMFPNPEVPFQETVDTYNNSLYEFMPSKRIIAYKVY